MQIPFHVCNEEDLMKVDSSTKPSDVCNFFIKKHNLNVTTAWALFESDNDGLFGMYYLTRMLFTSILITNFKII